MRLYLKIYSHFSFDAQCCRARMLPSVIQGPPVQLTSTDERRTYHETICAPRCLMPSSDEFRANAARYNRIAAETENQDISQLLGALAELCLQLADEPQQQAPEKRDHDSF